MDYESRTALRKRIQRKKCFIASLEFVSSGRGKPKHAAVEGGLRAPGRIPEAEPTTDLRAEQHPSVRSKQKLTLAGHGRGEEGLREVQLGGRPRDWKPVATVGPGVIEMRVRVGGAFRLVYIAKFAEAVYVLHVFQKKSQKTSPLDLAVARARLAAVRRARRGG